MQKRWIWIPLNLAALLFLLGGGAVWLTTTEAGLRFLVARAQGAFPSELTVKETSGALLGDLTLAGVQWQKDDLTARADLISLKLSPWALLTGTAHVRALHVHELSLKLPATEEAPPDTTAEEPLTLPEITLPLAIRIDDLQLNGFELTLPNQQYRLDQLTVALRASNAVEIDQISLILPQQDPIPPLALNVQGSLGLQAPHPLALTLTWESQLAPVGKMNGTLSVGGDSENLTLNHHLQPLALDVSAEITHPLTQLGWQAKLGLPELTWPLPDEDATGPPLVTLTSTQLTAAGSLADFNATLTSDVKGPNLPDSSWRLSVAGTPAQLTIKELWGKLLDGELSASGQFSLQPTVTGDFEIASENLRFKQYWPDWPDALTLSQTFTGKLTGEHLTIDRWHLALPPAASTLTTTGRVALSESGAHELKVGWENLQWPLTGNPLAQSREGALSLTGPLSNYTLSLQTDVLAEGAPSVDLNFEGTGNLERLETLQLTAHTLGGQIRVTGDTRWQPAVDWKLAVSAENLQPGLHWPALPGSLNASLSTAGSLNEQLEALVRLTDLSGHLRGYPLAANANVAVAGDALAIENFALHSGRTSVAAKGHYGKAAALTARVHAPELAELLPQAHGQLTANVHLSGAADLPALSLDLDGDNLGFEEWALTRVNGQLAFDLSTDQLAASLRAENVSQANQTRIEALQLDSKGTLSDHQLQASVSTPSETVSTHLKGGYLKDVQRWQGAIESLSALTRDFGHWVLAEPASLALAADDIALGQLCLQENQWQTSLCTQATQNSGGLKTSGHLNALPTGLAARPWLPEGFQIDDTQINADWQLSLSPKLPPEQQLQAQATLKVSEGTIHTNVQGEQHEFTHRGGTTQVSVDTAGLTATSEFSLLEDSRISLQAALPGLQPLNPAPDQTVSAKITTRVADLGLLPTFVPQLDKSEGAIQGDINIDGTLSAPQVVADVQLKDGLLSLPIAGLVLEDIQARLQADETGKARTQLKLKSGEGWLKITTDGQVTSAQDWATDVRIQGQNLLAVQVPDVRATVSPDLTLNVLPAGIRIQGRVDIPSADITPNVVIGESQTGGTAVKASSDVVLTDTSRADESTHVDETNSAPPFAVAGNVALQLGENVKLAVVGFNSKLAGGIRLTLDPKNAMPSAEGEIQIVDGYFRSYGQDLTIDKGRVLFLGGPADNPGLDIKAYRTIHDKPSEYLSAGKVSKAGVHIQGRAQEPRVKLFSEPMTDDKNILSYIVTGSALGGDIRKDLSLGTYLKPDLYVSIGYDLFENEKAFNLRYEINQRLGVEGTAGDRDSGVDFSYRLSR